MANHNVVFVEESGTYPAPLVKRQFRNARRRFGTANKKIIPLLLRKANAERSSNRPAGEAAKLHPRSISLYSHASASERPPSSSMSFSFTARRPSSTVPMSITSSPVWSISWV